jgi:hypothetical protein
MEIRSAKLLTPQGNFRLARDCDQNHCKKLQSVDPAKASVIEVLEELLEAVLLVAEAAHFFGRVEPQFEGHGLLLGHGHVDLAQGLLGPARGQVQEKLREETGLAVC